MSINPRFTELTPVRQEDTEEVVMFYNQEISAIQSDPNRMTMWSSFTNEQIADIIQNPTSDLLVLREKLGKTAVGNIVGGVIVDQDFSAWSPNEIELTYSHPRHFAKFLAKQGLGRSALWPSLLEYGKTNNISLYVAEAWDFTYDGLPKDNLKEYYTSLGMEWQGTVVYKNNYYGNIIGNERPVNRFSYDLDRC
jgi:hypothetical protein